jgi:Cys-tRNA(Pro) deacylase
MARPQHVSDTPATQWPREKEVPLDGHPYDYVERGGTAESARALGVEEHAVVKTLVMEDEARKPLVVLMHGDRQVSTRNPARQTGRKRIAPCDPAAAQRHSGYQVGGAAPFGLRKPMPVFVQRSVLDLDRI